MGRRAVVLVAFGALLVAAAGCAQAPTPTPAPIATPAPPATQAPVGTLTTPTPPPVPPSTATPSVTPTPTPIPTAPPLGTPAATAPPAPSRAEEGKRLAESFGCQRCHSIDGSPLVGPTWKGLLGKQETLADGRTVTVDEQFLLLKITDPASVTVKGFPQGLMAAALPNPPQDTEAGAIVDYIKSLE